MRLASVPLVVVLLAAWLASPAAAERVRPLTGRVLVSMAPTPVGTATAAAASATVASAGAHVSGPIVPQIGMVTVSPRKGETAAQLAARLREDPRVRSAQPERRSVPREVPDDPAFTTLEKAAGTPDDIPVEWWAAAENLPAAWDVTHGTGARVAIVDTGVDASHPDLKDRIVYAKNFGYSGSARTDEDGHGTHVASLACAQAGNGIGIAGAGYGCSIMVEKTDLSDASNIAAIIDAADHGADAINMSFGVDPDPVTHITPPPTRAGIDALRYARKKGAVLVAAAADRSDIDDQGDPASVLQPTGTAADISKGMGLSVTAAAYGGHRAWFAGRGSQISIAAYGAFDKAGGPRGLLGAFPAKQVALEIAQNGGDDSTDDDDVPACHCRVSFGGDSRYAYLAGTSMAAPQVAAIAAVMRHLNPDLRPSGVERILKETASRPAGTGWTGEEGWGVLDAGRAVAAARDTDRTPPVGAVTLVRRSADRVVVDVTGKDSGPPGVRVSGLASVQLYRTEGTKRVLVKKTRPGRVTLRLAPGAELSLTARAIDRAGNLQTLKTAARLRVKR